MGVSTPSVLTGNIHTPLVDGSVWTAETALRKFWDLLRRKTGALQRLQDEFNRWATRSPGNLRSAFEAGCLFCALGEYEQELMNQIVVRIDQGGSIQGVFPADLPTRGDREGNS